jgi:hypothetical protein
LLAGGFAGGLHGFLERRPPLLIQPLSHTTSIARFDAKR